MKVACMRNGYVNERTVFRELSIVRFLYLVGRSPTVVLCLVVVVIPGRLSGHNTSAVCLASSYDAAVAGPRSVSLRG